MTMLSRMFTFPLRVAIMSDMNTVTGGDYLGYATAALPRGLQLVKGFREKGPFLDLDSVAVWEEITAGTQVGVASAVGRAFIVGAILGPVGWLAALGARKNIHTIAVEWTDGKKSLLELDDKHFKVLNAKAFAKRA